MQQFQFHPTWNKRLHLHEKTNYETFFSTLPSPIGFSVVPYLIKKKKNGGLVVTALLQNGSDQTVDVSTIRLIVYNDQQEVVAEEAFSPCFALPATTTVPWSFVFSPSSVRALPLENIQSSMWQIVHLFEG